MMRPSPTQPCFFILLAIRYYFPYIFFNAPAMLLSFWYAHFGGLFYARKGSGTTTFLKRSTAIDDQVLQ